MRTASRPTRSGAALALGVALAAPAAPLVAPPCRADEAAAPAGAEAPPSEPRVRITGYLENDSAYRVREPLRWQKSQSRLALEAEARLPAGFSLRTSAWLLWDPIGRLVSDDPDLDAEPVDRWQVGGSRHLELELRDAILGWRGSVGGARLDLALGKQQVVWGQSIGLRILDVVNPQDYREFLLDDFNDARLTTFGLNAEAWIEGWTLQAMVFPDFEPNRLPARDGEFALDPALPGFLPALASFTAPPLVPQPFTLVDVRSERTPHDWRWATLGVGARVARTFGGVDLALHYWDAYDPAQAWRRTVAATPGPGGTTLPVNVLRAEHVRVHTLGGAFGAALGAFTLWGEGTFTWGRAFASGDLADADGIVRRPEMQSVVGVDWNGLDPLFVNVQWIQSLVVDHEDAIEVDRLRTWLTLLLRLPLRHETVIPQLFLLWGPNDHETMIRPVVEWKATDRLSIAVGADLFTGARDGLFGQYAHETRCQPVPDVFRAPGVAGCEPDFPPGRPGRAFVRVRWAFDTEL